MDITKPRLTGFELYFEDLERAREFYREILGLDLSEEMKGRYAKFDFPGAFLCLEGKGLESYASKDKAVVFFEVGDLKGTVARIGRERFLEVELEGDALQRRWAVLHDPEGHNVILIETPKAQGTD